VRRGMSDAIWVPVAVATALLLLAFVANPFSS